MRLWAADKAAALESCARQAARGSRRRRYGRIEEGE